MDKISIIVPIYNSQDTIERCIKSLLEQTYQNIEIILVNDGSTDDSLSICERFKNAYEQIIVISQPNGGVSSARNAGLKAASGEYIMFCDSDDWANNNWCEQLYKGLQIDSLVMSGYDIYTENNIEHCVDCKLTRIKREDYLSAKLIGGFALWNKCFSARVIEENNISFSTELTLGEDKLFIMEYLSCINGDITYIPKILYNYIWPYKDSLSVSFDTSFYNQCFLLYNRTIHLNSIIGCSSFALKHFYNDSYDMFENAIRAVLRSRNSFSTKLKLLNNVTSSNEYQEICENCNSSGNKITNWLRKRKSCYVVVLMYFLNRY